MAVVDTVFTVAAGVTRVADAEVIVDAVLADSWEAVKEKTRYSLIPHTSSIALHSDTIINVNFTTLSLKTLRAFTNITIKRMYINAAFSSRVTRILIARSELAVAALWNKFFRFPSSFQNQPLNGLSQLHEYDPFELTHLPRILHKVESSLASVSLHSLMSW